MIRFFVTLGAAAYLTGCASLTYPLPKCDGYSRRPLNRAMWQPETDSTLKQEHSSARPSASSYTQEKEEPPAFAHLDLDASYRPCEG